MEKSVKSSQLATGTAKITGREYCTNRIAKQAKETQLAGGIVTIISYKNCATVSYWHYTIAATGAAPRPATGATPQPATGTALTAVPQLVLGIGTALHCALHYSQLKYMHCTTVSYRHFTTVSSRHCSA